MEQRVSEQTQATHREHLPSGVIDAVRGLAAAYVVIFHTHLLLLLGTGTAAALGVVGITALTLRVVDLATKHGHAAVLAFFLVSGYAIHFGPAHRLASQAPVVVKWRTYAWHRIRRLYPPLIIALALTFVLDEIGMRFNPSYYAGNVPLEAQIVLPQALSLSSFFGTLAFVQGTLTPLFGSDGPLWSLAYEGFFYVAYPLVLLTSRRLGPLSCLAIFATIGGVGVVLTGLEVPVVWLPLLVYWPAWVAGATIADARVGRIRVAKHFWRVAALLAPLVLVGLAAVRALPIHTAQSEMLSDAVWVAAFMGPLGWLAAARHSDLTRARVVWLCRPLLRLGSMSYSLYVVHMPILVFLSAVWLAQSGTLPISPWLALLGMSVATLAGLGVYLVAERPLLSRRAEARAT